jgi:competence protein ComEA
MSAAPFRTGLWWVLFGLVVLILGAARPPHEGPSPSDADATVAAPCDHPIEVSGRVSRPGIVCGAPTFRAALRLAGPLGCELPPKTESSARAPPAARGPCGSSAGRRLVVGVGVGGVCDVAEDAMSAPLALAVGVPIDINEASAEAFDTLPRVGPRLAARIVADRERRGAFLRLEDLARVRGVGAKTLSRLRPHLCVGKGRSRSSQR